ncbi:O-antigen ligase [Streptomyces sp. NK08204]|uniref:O-antigen ligase family protein n=1 Tax=Streptomyces sp. NK08204 TaxID=2873260 RepID=UPI001CED5B35|nr:O-antigen ligase family protein [Streptomyces sp. NK08204]
MRSLPAVVIDRVALLAAGPVIVYLALFHGAAATAAAVAIAFAVIVWPRPDVALLMLLGLVPVIAVVHSGGSPLYVTVVGGVGLLLVRLTLNGLRARLELLLILLMACAVTLSCLLPPESLRIEHQWKGCALMLAGLGMLAASMLAPPDPRRIAQLVGGAGAGVAGYLLARGEYASGRLTGLGLNPNYVGAVLALALVATIGLARFHRTWVWLGPAVVCTSALVETRSRGAFLMAAVGLAGVLLAGRPVRYKVLIALALIVATQALPEALDSVQGDLTGSRTSTELTANTEVRKQAAALALRVALDHPLRGIGYGLFPEYARTSSTLGIYIDTHNDYLRLAAETGSVTLALLVALLWLGLVRRYAADHSILQSLCAAFAVGLLFANALTSFVVSTPFWISLGCLMGHAAHRKKDPSPLPSTT